MGSPTKTKRSPGRRLLTYAEAGEYLTVGRTTMYDLVAKGELPTVKIRRSTRFKPEDLDDYIDSQTQRRPRI